MKILYLECNTGAAGDMLMGALLELHPDRDNFLKRLNSAGIPGVRVYAEPSEKCGIMGTHIRVKINGTEESEHAAHEHVHTHEHIHENIHSHEHIHAHDGHCHNPHELHSHSHSSLQDALELINSLSVSEKVKMNASAVYRIIAEAEGRAHGKPIDKIHFHEVGELDAIADIVGVCMLIDELKPDIIFSSPVCTGFGSVRCAHGILPVPAPATAYILRGMPVYGGDIEGELCTPTGAALLRRFVSDFGALPLMRIEKTGIGAGTKSLPAANCVRAMLGDNSYESSMVTELRCNIDDMTGEAASFAADTLMRSGALDAFITPIFMKKNRPGLLLTCLCRETDREKMLTLIFRHTSTIGVREYKISRHTMQRREVLLNTSHGTIRGKESSGFGAIKIKPEYDDLSRIARENGIAISDIKINGISDSSEQGMFHAEKRIFEKK